MAEHEDMLRKQLEKIAEDNNFKDPVFEIDATSSGGANYTSVLYNMTISSTNNEELHLFAKVMKLDKNARENFGGFNVFDTEHYVYRDLAKIFNKLEVECEVPDKERYVFPKFYLYNPTELEETIILENLVKKGYELYDRFISIDWPYASKAVETIAKYHALNMAYAEKNPEEFEKLLTDFTSKIEKGYQVINDNFPQFVETTLTVLKEEYKKRFNKFVDRVISSGNVLTNYFTRRYRRPVLVHGDFRQSNIMHKVNKDGTINLIPVDYQTLQSGSGVLDLLYFIFTGSDAQFRARYYLRLIDHYYVSLRKALQRLRLDPDKVYSRKDFDDDLREALPYGLIIAIIILPVGTVESVDAPDMNGEDVFKQMANLKVGKTYSDRINGVIDDFVKLGIL